MISKTSKTRFLSWVEITSCHGIWDLVHSKSHCARFGWTLFLVFCSISAFTQIGTLMKNFLAEPHYTTLTYQEESEYAEFPNITVCNLNRVHRGRAIELGMVTETGELETDILNYIFLAFRIDYDLSLLELEIYPNMTAGLEMLDGYRKKYHKFLASLNMTHEKNFMELVKFLSYKCQEVFMGCKWNQFGFDCCSYAKRVINSYGICWAVSPPITNPRNARARQTVPGRGF